MRSANDPPIAVPAAAVRDCIFASNSAVQARFQSEFPTEIARAIHAITSAHRALDHFRARVPHSLQSEALELFFHSAIHAVLCSVHHLVSGFPIAAGNLMRHFTESVSMALLCLDPEFGVLGRLAENAGDYPVHQAPTKLRQRKVRASLKAKIGFDSEAWETTLKISELYDQLSHASAVSIGHQLLSTQKNALILGSEYDPGKREPYRSELMRSATAAESLAHLIYGITDWICPRA